MMQLGSAKSASDEFGIRGRPTVLLIHGLGLNRACWQWMVPALEQNYHVITFDLFGHGQSDDPPTEPCLSLFSKQAQRVLDDYGISGAIVIGFSLGGMIARRFAQDAPDRTRALVILHSAHTRSEAAQKAIVKRVQQAQSEGASATVDDALERWFTDDYRRTHPEMMDLVRSWVMANPKHIYHRNYSVLANGVAEIVAPTPAITRPALVVTASDDFGNSPAMANEIAAEIEGAETVILPGLRHMALAEDPEAVNAPILRFLNSLAKENAV